VKLLRVQNEHYVFRLTVWERKLLAVILNLYPVIPAAHQTLSKFPATTNKANQKLLDEALAEHRNENKSSSGLSWRMACVFARPIFRPG